MTPRSLVALALLAMGACAPRGTVGRDVVEAPRGKPDVDSARELDQEGVHAFRDGRWADAIRYFRAAYAAGGPPSEIWNVARCKERLDDAEGAALALDEYLAGTKLSAEDRAEATREAVALRARPSLLTVTTQPNGATVIVDGRQSFGPTPATTSIAPGAHTLSVHRAGFAAETRAVEARFGQGLLVSIELSREGKP